MEPPAEYRGVPIPRGLDDLLDEMSCMILRHQPKNIYLFLAEYLERKLRQRDNPDSESKVGDQPDDEIVLGTKGEDGKAVFQNEGPKSQIKGSSRNNSKVGLKDGQNPGSKSSSRSNSKAGLQQGPNPGSKGSSRSNSKGRLEGSSKGRTGSQPKVSAGGGEALTYDELAAQKAQADRQRSHDREHKPNSVTRRIDELSSVLNDALEKGQALSKLHGKDQPPVTLAKRPSRSKSNGQVHQVETGKGSGGSPKDDLSSPTERHRDKITYMGKDLQRRSQMLQAHELHDARAGRPLAVVAPTQTGGHKPDGLTTRITALSTVLGDALEMGQALSKLHGGTQANKRNYEGATVGKEDIPKYKYEGPDEGRIITYGGQIAAYEPGSDRRSPKRPRIESHPPGVIMESFLSQLALMTMTIDLALELLELLDEFHNSQTIIKDGAEGQGPDPTADNRIQQGRVSLKPNSLTQRVDVLTQVLTSALEMGQQLAQNERERSGSGGQKSLGVGQRELNKEGDLGNSELPGLGEIRDLPQRDPSRNPASSGGAPEQVQYYEQGQARAKYQPEQDLARYQARQDQGANGEGAGNPGSADGAGGVPDQGQGQDRSRQGRGITQQAGGIPPAQEYELLPNVSSIFNIPDLNTDPPPAEAAVARIDNRIPDQWRSVDLSEVGRDVGSSLIANIGNQLGIMKRIFLGEMDMAEAPYHAVALGITLGAAVAITVGVVRFTWRLVY